MRRNNAPRSIYLGHLAIEHDAGVVRRNNNAAEVSAKG